jgi:hypothetical protein
MFKYVLGIAAGLMLFSNVAMAACSVPNTLTNGTTADATAVMGNFTSLAGCAAPLITPTFSSAISVNGLVSNYAQINVNSNGGAGNGYGAVLSLLNTNGVASQLRLADTGPGTNYATEQFMLTMSVGSGYGIKINTNATDNNGLRIATTGATSCYPSCSNVSDRRIKTDITRLKGANGLVAINALRPISYYWKDPKKGSGEQIGFVAQDVRDVFPQAVINTGIITKDAPDGILSLNYSALTAPMVLAIQQLDARTNSVIAMEETALSDGRQQASIEPLRDNALSIVKQLRPVSFKSDDNKQFPSGRQIGFVAREVWAAAPDLVFMRKDKGNELALKSGSLIPILTKAVQEQQTQIAELKAANDNQSSEITRLEAQMRALQRKIVVQTAQR